MVTAGASATATAVVGLMPAVERMAADIAVV
jgi:hypothetical protein